MVLCLKTWKSRSLPGLFIYLFRFECMIINNNSNKTAIVTGGTSGIGLEICHKLLENNIRVATFSSTKKKVNTLKKTYENNINFFVCEADVEKKNQVNQFFNKAIKKFNKIDILINNVGGGGNFGEKDFINTDISLWDKVISKNLNSAVLFTKLCLPFMLKNTWGRVITISSISTQKYTGRPWYNVAKNSQIALMNSLSGKKEYTKNGVTFNTVSPGTILTKSSDLYLIKKNNPKKYKKIIDAKFPLGRPGNAKDVANLINFLCSDDAAYLNGSNIVIDGGESKLSFEI